MSDMNVIVDFQQYRRKKLFFGLSPPSKTTKIKIKYTDDMRCNPVECMSDRRCISMGWVRALKNFDERGNPGELWRMLRIDCPVHLCVIESLTEGNKMVRTRKRRRREKKQAWEQQTDSRFYRLSVIHGGFSLSIADEYRDYIVFWLTLT